MLYRSGICYSIAGSCTDTGCLFYGPVFCYQQGIQCLLQVADQVFCILKPDAEAQQAVGYARCFTGRFMNAFMRHGSRMADEAFNAAKAFGQFKILRGSGEADGALCIVIL